jgi:uncharacterized protein with NRDE domain
MCLILLGIDPSPGISVILAANRDEFYSRPTAPMAFWDQPCQMLAGRDLHAFGTWMGISATGRFAALTNYRDMTTIKPNAPSRGNIIPDLLASALTIPDFLTILDKTAAAFNGFNLIAGQGSKIFWYSNMDRRIHGLLPGIHGLSNHLLDTPWPKITRGKKALAQCIQKDPWNDDCFFDLLLDRQQPCDKLLPDTGIGLEWERILSPLFIQSPTYGTRSATLMRVTTKGNILVKERTFSTTQTPACSPEFEERRFTIAV